MRIVGNNRDYYDSARAFGADPSTVFVRKSRTHYNDDTVDLMSFPRSARPSVNPYFLVRKKDGSEDLVQAGSWYSNRYSTFNGFLVWFAGKAYRGIYYKFTDGKTMSSEIGRGVAWSKEALIRGIDACGYEIGETRTTAFDEKRGRSSLDDFFRVVHPDRAALDWLMEHQIAVAISKEIDYSDRREPGFAVNTNGLSDLNFQTVLEPYSAFQELSMWVGGTLPRTGNEMVTLSDKEKLRKHGFDNKISFRKEKQTNANEG